MKEVQVLERLGAAARREQVPQVDVTLRVSAALRHREDDSDRPLAWIAGFATAAAIPAAVAAVFALDALMDPLVVVFGAFHWLMV